jgi:hypothetical protein
MCHIDVADKVAGTRHQAKGVRCIKCHGTSLGHVQDENNQVKPDRIFTRRGIDNFCGTCHACSRTKGMAHAAIPAGNGRVCTQCHGAHKILRRPDV